MTYGDMFIDYWKECFKEMYSHSEAKIRLVQQCAAISAIVELSLCL